MRLTIGFRMLYTQPGNYSGSAPAAKNFNNTAIYGLSRILPGARGFGCLAAHLRIRLEYSGLYNSAANYLSSFYGARSFLI
jgi:hypothetical protein